MSSPQQQKIYRLEKSRGIQHTVPVEPAASHIQRLMAAGFHPQAIADVSGVAETVIAALARGDYRHDKLRRSTAQAILSTTQDRLYRRPLPSGSVPPTGTVRRIKALLALGWTHKHIQAAMGGDAVRTPDIVSGGWRVTRTTREAVIRAYEELSGKPGPSKITRTKALRLGYAPPLAWDDIDNPDEQPDGHGTDNDSAPADLDEFAFLLSTGTSAEQAAARLGTTLSALARRARHHGRLDIAARADAARAIARSAA